MKILKINIYACLSVLLLLQIFFVSTASAQQYKNFDECMAQNSYEGGDSVCCANFPNNQLCLGGRSGTKSSTGGSGSSEFCPSDKFDVINGLCVPKQQSGQPGSLVRSSSVFELIAISLRWLFTFAGVIATVFLIIGGYQYITAAGNEEQAEKGKKTLINSIIGIVVVVLAITIVTIVTNTLGSPNPIGTGALYIPSNII